MARTTNYGLGQYRFNKTYSYINWLNSSAVEEGQSDVNYYTNGTDDINFQDVCITLPSYNNNPLIRYGNTYYVELTLPQNAEYPITLDLKLCAANSENAINPNRFQNIKRLIIPASKKDDIYSDVLLYEDVNDPHNIKVDLVEDDPGTGNDRKPGHVYKTANQSFYTFDQHNSWTEIENKTFTTIPQTWKINSGIDSTVTFKFAFSPKFNLEAGYPFLLLETSRENPWSQTMQWISNQQTYYGTVLDISKISFKIYSVSNLLEGQSTGQSQIQSGTGQLTHIGIWGHPEQIFTINGEEIKIGQSGFYELNDFTITSLGVVVTDSNVDRFTIDYEYKIIN